MYNTKNIGAAAQVLLHPEACAGAAPAYKRMMPTCVPVLAAVGKVCVGSVHIHQIGVKFACEFMSTSALHHDAHRRSRSIAPSAHGESLLSQACVWQANPVTPGSGYMSFQNSFGNA
jgi:hypothetical protein